MPTAHFRFYAELNDHLPPERRMRSLEHEFQAGASVKDRIEALGVPHTEVDLILANGDTVDFSYLVQPGDRISVYPMFESIDITPVLRVRPQPLRHPRFVLDTHLGRLAKYLRMLGFDTVYRNDCSDAELARIEREESRILLTRDRGLLKRSAVTRGYYVRETAPRRQATEVVSRFDLANLIDPFRLCLCCGAALIPVSKDAIRDRLEPATSQHYQEFRQCLACGRIYWQGSHYRRMQRLIEDWR